MDLDELRAFIAVADTGSFSAAAKSLDFARATLRRQVDELEARSGVQLLKRAADGASVTRAGEILAKKGRSLLGDTKTLFDAVRALDMQDDLIAVEVPFGQPPSMEQTAHATFRRAAPNLRWHVRYTDGRFNPTSHAAFSFHVGPPVGEAGSWESTRIVKAKVGLQASQEYLDKRGVPTTLPELREHDLLVWERHDRDPNYLPLKPGVAEPHAIRPKLVSPSAHTLRYFASCGEGISLVPVSPLPSFLGGEPTQRVMKEVVEDEVELWFSARKDALVGPLGVLASALTKLTRTAFGLRG